MFLSVSCARRFFTFELLRMALAAHALLTSQCDDAQITDRSLLQIGRARNKQAIESVGNYLSEGDGIGSTASLDETGYRSVAEACCDEEMLTYLRRVLDFMKLDLCNEFGLMGLAPCYNCQNVKTFDELIKNLEKSTPPSWCFFVAPQGQCKPWPKDMVDTCGGSYNPEQLKDCGDDVVAEATPTMAPDPTVAVDCAPRGTGLVCKGLGTPDLAALTALCECDCQACKLLNDGYDCDAGSCEKFGLLKSCLPQGGALGTCSLKHGNSVAKCYLPVPAACTTTTTTTLDCTPHSGVVCVGLGSPDPASLTTLCECDCVACSAQNGGKPCTRNDCAKFGVLGDCSPKDGEFGTCMLNPSANAQLNSIVLLDAVEENVGYCYQPVPQGCPAATTVTTSPATTSPVPTASRTSATITTTAAPTSTLPAVANSTTVVATNTSATTTIIMPAPPSNVPPSPGSVAPPAVADSTTVVTSTTSTTTYTMPPEWVLLQCKGYCQGNVSLVEKAITNVDDCKDSYLSNYDANLSHVCGDIMTYTDGECACLNNEKWLAEEHSGCRMRATMEEYPTWKGKPENAQWAAWAYRSVCARGDAEGNCIECVSGFHLSEGKCKVDYMHALTAVGGPDSCCPGYSLVSSETECKKVAEFYGMEYIGQPANSDAAKKYPYGCVIDHLGQKNDELGLDGIGLHFNPDNSEGKPDAYTLFGWYGSGYTQCKADSAT